MTCNGCPYLVLIGRREAEVAYCRAFGFHMKFHGKNPLIFVTKECKNGPYQKRKEENETEKTVGTLLSPVPAP